MFNFWFLCLFTSVFGLSRSGQVCFPFQTPDISMESSSDIPSQGRPGKIGPIGPPGSKGERGDVGDPGTCACDPSEIEELLEEIQLRDNEIAEMRDRLNIISSTNRASFCGVGMKDGRVTDDQISASSVYDNRYLPKYARLERQGTNSAFGGWLACSSCRSPGEWIQVDLLQPTRVVAVVTQGFNYPGNAQEWATSYKISFGNTTNDLQIIRNANGADLIFNGNTDNNSKVFNNFSNPVTARYFRLIVQSWNNWGVVRLEYLTC